MHGSQLDPGALAQPRPIRLPGAVLGVGTEVQPPALRLDRADRPPADDGLVEPARVLLVEDDHHYAALLREMLVEGWPAPLEVTHATTVRWAGQRLAQGGIDCVLVDLSLPDAEGLESVRHIKATAPSVPVVVLTGNDDEALAVDALREGAQDYLPKGQADGPLVGRAIRYAIERKDSELALARQAFHDPLTGLPNRTLFADRMQVALAQVLRGKTEIALLFIDLDGFKTVNDSLGHEAGDRLLIEVARRLAEGLRPTDTVARMGGDEFLVLCPDVKGPEDVAPVVRRIGEAISLCFTVDDRELRITPSVGIAMSDGPGTRGEDLLRDADAAMYRAKQRPGFAYEWADGDLHASALRRLDIETELLGAIERGELDVHYQPQVDLENGRLVGLEALVRWDHPTRGLLMPSAFLDVAEASGLIVPLGAWILERACHQLREWQAQDKLGDSIRLSVNVSARQLEAGGLASSVADVLADAGLEPSSLTLELTESTVLHQANSDALSQLSASGVRIALDDFGTGYNSLSAVAELPIAELKIDRSFVSELETHAHKRRIVHAILELGRSLELPTVAEGIERPEQLAWLRGRGCRRGQGFLLASPQPPEVVGRYLACETRFPHGRDGKRPCSAGRFAPALHEV